MDTEYFIVGGKDGDMKRYNDWQAALTVLTTVDSQHHPNIITIFDVGEDGDRFFIVMELLRGATLKDFLKQGDGSGLERKLNLMSQLCAGLGAAHNASIYHRDIKPGNIFVRADGILKILDFGVSKVMDCDCLSRFRCTSQICNSPKRLVGRTPVSVPVRPDFRWLATSARIWLTVPRSDVIKRCSRLIA